MANKSQTKLQTVCNKVIANETKRQTAGDLLNDVFVQGKRRHLPNSIKQTLSEKIDVCDKTILCCDCFPPHCGNCKGVHVFIEANDLDVRQLSSLIREEVEVGHEDFCHSIIVVRKGTFQQYFGSNDEVNVYKLRNDIFLGLLPSEVFVFKYENASQFACEKTNDSLVTLCHKCQVSVDCSTPLHWSNVDIIQEFELFVPLDFQVFLTSFISKESLPRVADKKEYLKEKLVRLYLMFHSLLNLKDFKYTGVLQQCYTDILSQNYQTASTVFAVTNHAGLTQSLRQSERRLKSESNEYSCHFNTYQRQFPLEYETLGGRVTHHLNLLDCYLVVCIDNLVRLSVSTDPGRGEGRTHQKCTLPITIMGMPRDAKLVSEWHNPSTCDNELSQSPKCSCMKEVTLKKEDLQKVLIEPSQEEAMMLQKFKMNFAFGMPSLWACLRQDVSNSLSNTVGKVEQDRQATQGAQLQQGKFQVFRPPPILSRHPPPYTGKDDDPVKLKEILSDIMKKTGKDLKYLSRDESRVLLAPDFKIAKSLFGLMKSDPTFKVFLPEFPLLHLRKSKILNLISAYREAGVLNLVRFMRDTNETDPNKLIRPEQIEVATKFIRRLAMAIQVVFLLKFTESLSTQDAKCCLDDLGNGGGAERWEERYNAFISMGELLNGTFALHADLLRHCMEILAIHMAEKIGGPDGYKLLLAAVKSSLPFSFLNGAASYAGFCTQLLIHHYSAGFFHQRLKETLFSTPHKNSTRNFALDTQREMDHKTALKGFRPRSSLDSVIPRMSLVDKFDEIDQREFGATSKKTTGCKVQTSVDIYKPTAQDIEFIKPTVEMMMKSEHFSTNPERLPYNIYAETPKQLSLSFLDKETQEAGLYLIRRFLVKEKLMGMEENDIQFQSLTGPAELLAKLKSCKSVTIKRTCCKNLSMETKFEKGERERKTEIKRQTKNVECMSSQKNVCQAVIKPDLTKPDTNKAHGVRTAIVDLVSSLCDYSSSKKSVSQQEEVAEHHGLIYLQKSILPGFLSSSSVAVIEFAGIKFKVKNKASTGQEYLTFVDKTIGRLFRTCPNLESVVIAEEKYSFTPDAMKTATRQNRKQSDNIGHLKEESAMINLEKLDYVAITETARGRQAISKFVASNVNKLTCSGKQIELIVDSELHIRPCECQDSDCQCSETYSRPLRARYDEKGYMSSSVIENIKQRKGEGEMAQFDWVVSALKDFHMENKFVVSLVTSGDIDAVIIHLFGVSNHLRRNKAGKYDEKVYVILQKPNGKYDIYNIVSIVEIIEERFGVGSAMKIAAILCMGGNDFLPKFHGITHCKLLRTVLLDDFMPNLITFSSDESGRTVKCEVAQTVFMEVLKRLYCQGNYDSSKLSFHEVRQYSIKDPGKQTFNPPNKWMPPIETLLMIVDMVNWNLSYLMTAGNHSSILPACPNGNIFLPESKSPNMAWKVSHPAELLAISEESLTASLEKSRTKRPTKRKQLGTPQKGCRRKLPLTDSPKIPMQAWENHNIN